MPANERMSMAEQELRQQLLSISQQLLELGLNRGSSGNASVRAGDDMLITPSALPVSVMTPDSMVRMDLPGNVLQAGQPSREWRFHRDILAARREIGAVIHAPCSCGGKRFLNSAMFHGPEM